MATSAPALGVPCGDTGTGPGLKHRTSGSSKELNVDFRWYRILGACNPPFSYQALQAEDNIGTMLPCNVVVQETRDGKVEIWAVDPVASMAAIQNPTLGAVAEQVRAKLKGVVERL